MKIQRSLYVSNFNENSLEILGIWEFDETWPICSLLHLVARKNKFPTKMAQEFEFLSRREFGLI
jgi:hypothetical protein